MNTLRDTLTTHERFQYTRGILCRYIMNTMVFPCKKMVLLITFPQQSSSLSIVPIVSFQCSDDIPSMYSRYPSVYYASPGVLSTHSVG